MPGNEYVPVGSKLSLLIDTVPLKHQLSSLSQSKLVKGATCNISTCKTSTKCHYIPVVIKEYISMRETNKYWPLRCCKAFCHNGTVWLVVVVYVQLPALQLSLVNEVNNNRKNMAIQNFLLSLLFWRLWSCKKQYLAILGISSILKKTSNVNDGTNVTCYLFKIGVPVHCFAV